MPITAIITQPAVDSINAAYRPIIFRVGATRTDATPIPPVVYCDIYINGIFYRTLSKTQYTKLNAGVNTEWEFDVQDAVQEYLKKYMADIGHDTVIDVTDIIAQLNCRFRSSGNNVDGFLIAEDIAPVQGTDNVPPTPGTGTLSNFIYVVNVTLQHEDNQILGLHLDSYKHRTWDANSYPLTHRPDNYKVCVEDSDTFPILSQKVPARLVLHYMLRNTNIWLTDNANLPCDAVDFPAFILTPAAVGVVYDVTVSLDGTAPFTLSDIIKPAWMTINIVGSDLKFGGTPGPGDIGANFPVSFRVNNCIASFKDYAGDVDVNCTPVSRVNADAFPDGVVNQLYELDVPLNGSQPISIVAGTLNIPGWMAASIVNGNILHLEGTPLLADVANNISVYIELENICGGPVLSIDESIDVTGSGGGGGGGAYADPNEYGINALVTGGLCDVTVQINRSVAARDAAIADNKTVRVHFHVVADNTCEIDDFIDMPPASVNGNKVVTLLCGTGPCGGATASINMLEIL